MIWSMLTPRRRDAGRITENVHPAQALCTSGLATRRLHLGCGIESLGHGAKVLAGWTNVDVVGDGVRTFAWDLTEPFPLPDGSIDFIYSEHFIEHVSLAAATALLVECRRVLGRGGVVRLSTPDLRVITEKYVTGDIREWHDMGWEPATPCDLLNEGLRNWGHCYVYDEPKLLTILRAAGFADVARRPWGQSAHQPLSGLETRPDHGDLIVEGSA